MIYVILAIGVILFAIREITKYGNQDTRDSSIDTINSRCGHKQDERGCKESCKCLHNKREV